MLTCVSKMWQLCTRAGVHTKKLYHIGQRIPFWVRAILPGLKFDLEEEAWTLGPQGEITLVLHSPFLRITHLTTPQAGSGGVSKGSSRTLRGCYLPLQHACGMWCAHLR